MTSARQTLLVVSHTHWDREWYRTAEQFRVRLVPLIDEVLDGHGPFLLDGQAVVLHDYLDWRPERRDALSARLCTGAVEAGPWYVLADTLMPSGEALVRNLLTGRRTLGALGVAAPPVLYCPDAFGHPAAGPALAAGFGMTMAVVWRGYGGRGWPAGDAARWRAASGEEVQLYHLPPSGYEHGASLPTAASDAAARWPTLRHTLAERATLPTLLLLNGADHHAPQTQLDAALDLGRSVLGDCDIRRATLAEFAESRGTDGACVPLPVVAGELRCAPSYVWSLPGAGGSRAAHKRANAGLERLLVRNVEPWTAHAWWRTGLDLSFAERALWRLTLESHAHDTLCGCSIDAVADAMHARMQAASDGARDVRDQAVQAIAGIDADAARTVFATTARTVLVSNPVPRSRSGLVDVEVELPLAPVPVGPGSGPGTTEPRPVPQFSLGNPALPVQRLQTSRAVVLHESPHHYPRACLAWRERVLVWAPELPPFGTVALPITERRSRPRVPSRVSVQGRALSSDAVTVWFDAADGLCCSSAGHTVRNLLGMESVGDRGDLYTHEPMQDTHREATCVSQRVTMRGPLRAELTLAWRVPVAPRALRSSGGEPLVRRAGHHVVEVGVQLDAGATWFRLVVRGTNRESDQRLRLLVRTGCAGSTHRADAAFGEIERQPPPLPQDGDTEVPAPTAPLHRYVSRYDVAHARGTTLVSDGLTEYEAMLDGTVAVTLVRSVGELSRADLTSRPGHAGWPSPTPGAQSPGPWEATFGVLLHGLASPETRAQIATACDDILVPATGRTVAAIPPAAHAGLALEGAHLAFVACKRSDDGAALVVRCVNLSSRPAQGSWSLPGLEAAQLARLDESALGELPVCENRVRFAVPPHAVSTIVLQRN